MVTPTTDPNNIYGPYNEKLRLHYDKLKQIADNIDSLTELSISKDALVEVNNSKDAILELNTYSDLRDNLSTILSMPAEFTQTTENVNNALNQANIAISTANSANTATNEAVLIVTEKTNEAKEYNDNIINELYRFSQGLPPISLTDFGPPLILTRDNASKASASDFTYEGKLINIPVDGSYYAINTTTLYENGKNGIQSQQENEFFSVSVQKLEGTLSTAAIRFIPENVWMNLENRGTYWVYEGNWPENTVSFDLNLRSGNGEPFLGYEPEYRFGRQNNPYLNIEEFKTNYSNNTLYEDALWDLTPIASESNILPETIKTIKFDTDIPLVNEEYFWAIKLSEPVKKAWVINDATSSVVQIGLENVKDGWYMGRNIIGDGELGTYGITRSVSVSIDNFSTTAYTAKTSNIERILLFKGGNCPKLVSSILPEEPEEETEEETINLPTFLPLSNVEINDLPNGNLRIIGSRLKDGNLYYSLGRALYISRDNGYSFSLIMDTTANNELGAPSLIIPAGDGEVLLACNQDGILKSSGWTNDPNIDLLTTVTWRKMADATGVSQVHSWGMDSDGKGNVVVTQYSASTFSDSNDVLLSTDSGETFTVIRSINNVNHLHFVVIDKYATHLPSGTIRIGTCYHSSTTPDPDEPTRRVEFCDYNTLQTPQENLANWVALPYSDLGINQRNPTVCVISPKGYIFGSDRGTSAIHFAKRTENLSDLLINLVTPSGHADTTALNFAIYGQWYPEYNMGIISFISQANGNFAQIFATDGEKATEIYTSEVPENNGYGYREFSVDKLGYLHVYNPVFRNGSVIKRHLKALLPEKIE